MINKNFQNYLTRIKKTMTYIYIISPKYFIMNLLFTILIGVTSAMSILATKSLINGIVGISIGKEHNLIKVLFIFAIINICTQLIHSISQFISAKHQTKIDYKMNMDILEKCNELNLKDFEDSETYNLLGKAEIEGQTKVYITYRNVL